MIKALNERKKRKKKYSRQTFILRASNPVSALMLVSSLCPLSHCTTHSTGGNDITRMIRGPSFTHVIARNSFKSGCNWKTPNSFYSNTQMQHSLLCFVSFTLIIEWGENGTQVQRGWERAPWSVAGKVFNWVWYPCWGAQFLSWKRLWWECPFVRCFGSVGEMKTFTTGYYVGRSRHVPGDTCTGTGTLLSASLPLHKWKWSCGVGMAQLMECVGRNTAGAKRKTCLLLHRQKPQPYVLAFICLWCWQVWCIFPFFCSFENS